MTASWRLKEFSGSSQKGIREGQNVNHGNEKVEKYTRQLNLLK